ncbi:MAG: hypothetical protein ACRC0X_06560 [Brevinema sp.]
MYKYFLLIMIITGCEKKPVTYEIIFEAMLGFEDNQIGSNIPILESYTNRQGLPNSFLTDIPEMVIDEANIYIADSYNKKINVFPLIDRRNNSKALKTVLSIPNQGKGYRFARPYRVLVDYHKDIYVLASIEDLESYEVQNYSNQTAEIQNYDKFQEQISKIPAENFYLYKFSSKGEFIHHLGMQGVTDTQAFRYPDYMDSDRFGNFYLGFYDIQNNQQLISIYRYSSHGNKNFEFTSKDFDIQSNLNDIYYQGNIISVNNYKNKEELALVIEYQPISNNNQELIPANIDNTWSSLNSYNIDNQTLAQEIVNDFGITESILGIDSQDRIFFQSFDEQADALKIRIVDTETKQETVYHTPLQSEYYILFNYFIDHQGNLYNYLLDRNRKLIVLQWNINTQDNTIGRNQDEQ